MAAPGIEAPAVERSPLYRIHPPGVNGDDGSSLPLPLPLSGAAEMTAAPYAVEGCGSATTSARPAASTEASRPIARPRCRPAGSGGSGSTTAAATRRLPAAPLGGHHSRRRRQPRRRRRRSRTGPRPPAGAAGSKSSAPPGGAPPMTRPRSTSSASGWSPTMGEDDHEGDTGASARTGDAGNAGANRAGAPPRRSNRCPLSRPSPWGDRRSVYHRGLAERHRPTARSPRRCRWSDGAGHGGRTLDDA